MPIALACALVVATAASAATTTLVVCAPGYPGSTAEAQPSLDVFARVAGAAAGWPPGSLAAVYHETEDAGLRRLAQPDAALALVPWPFYVKHAAALKLAPLSHAASKAAGAEESWALVAKKGRLDSASRLSGWEIVSLAGYAPAFVRGGALAAWGKIPTDARVTESGQVLSALRRAAAGEDVAVLLDGAQAAALASLPFAGELEVVASSPKVPVAVLCTVGTRLPPARARVLSKALVSLHESPEGAQALEGLRLVRFVPANTPSRPASK